VNDKSTDCGSVAPDEVWLLVNRYGGALIVPDEQTARDTAERWNTPESMLDDGPHTVHRYVRATESGSVARSPMRQHLDAVGAVIDALGPGEEATSDVRRDLGLPAPNNDGDLLEPTECRSVAKILGETTTQPAAWTLGGLASQLEQLAGELQDSDWSDTDSEACQIAADVLRVFARNTEQESVSDGHRWGSNWAEMVAHAYTFKLHMKRSATDALLASVFMRDGIDRTTEENSND